MEAFRSGDARRAGGDHGHRGRGRHPRRVGDGRSRTPTGSASPSSTSCAAGSAGAASRRGASCCRSPTRPRRRPGSRPWRPSTDGFVLADVDLELRGEGTILGARQKGRSDLKLARLLSDRDLVVDARSLAVELVDADPHLDDHRLLVEELRLFVDDDEAEFLFKS